MAEVASGIRSVLAHPIIYRVWEFMLGGDRVADEYVDQYLRPSSGDRILDIGCGPATILESIPKTAVYVGFDISKDYIDAARRRFGDRGEFIHASVGEPPPLSSGSFDIVSACGLLHHLDDEQMLGALCLARDSLKIGGRLITFDPVLNVRGQPLLARWLIERDRGQNVRSADQYLSLTESVFSRVEAEIRHDLLNVPYTHFIMQCHKVA